MSSGEATPDNERSSPPSAERANLRELQLNDEKQKRPVEDWA
jgi:hypothetical protein